MKLGELLSENEKKMFTDLGSSGLFEFSDISISVKSLYDANAKDCFMFDKKGPAVEAFRRAYHAFECAFVPKRKTEEFEKLIAYDK